MKKQFSVLMSVYAKEKPEYLSEALDSIIKQTVVPDEIVLVEDGPLSSGLLDVIQRYKERGRIKSVKLQKNVGLGAALNKGLEVCSYDLVARMDSDDISYPDRFERQLEVFKRNQDVDIVSSWISEFSDSTDNIVSVRRLPEQHSDIAKFAKRRCPINHPAVMFRKEAVIASGGYKHFRLFEDYYLWARMLVHGCTFYNIQEPLLWFRVSLKMYKRRGGIRYTIDEIKFQSELKNLGLINNWEKISNIGIRMFVRLIPNSMRSFLYRKFLRGKDIY